MKNFKEFYSELEEKKFRAISKTQRRKQAFRMAKLAKTSAFKLKVAKSKLKILPPEKLKIKAHKKAKEKIVNKYFPKYNELSMAGKLRVDQIIASKYGNAIAKIAQKIMPKMKALEMEKVKKAREVKIDA